MAALELNDDSTSEFGKLFGEKAKELTDRLENNDISGAVAMDSRLTKSS